MPVKIYTAKRGRLVKQGDMGIFIFPSGLVRLEQTFVCLEDDIQTQRATLANGKLYPLDFEGTTLKRPVDVIDGFYIYPQPTEKMRGDGFAELYVTAFGRLNETGKTTLEWKVWEENGTFKKIDDTEVQVTSMWTNRVKRVEKVVKTTDANNFLPSSEFSFISQPDGATIAQRIEGVESNTEISIRCIGIRDYQATGYGFFTEIKYSVDSYKFATLPVQDGE
jgi:hypothetical protein